ncbi:hypothetical protein SRIMM317S_01586 [Streptomyces rimosus subsp. rimosus]
MPRRWYWAIRSATSAWLPTRAVPAPPRTRPMPAQRLGATSSPSVLPPCSASIRRCPSDSLRASPSCTARTVSGENPASRRRASAHASSAVSRVITCSRMPKRTVRPASAASFRIQVIFSATCSGGSPQVRYTSLKRAATSPAAAEDPAEVDRRYGVGDTGQPCLFDAQVLPVEVDRPPLPQVPHDAQEFAGTGVARVLVEEVAVRTLLVALASGDDVQKQPPRSVPLEGGRHLGGEGGRDDAGPEGDQEFQALGLPGEHRRGEPGVLAPGAGRGQRALEAELFGGAGDLGEVAEGGGALAARRAGGQAVAAADDVPAVAVGRQEPVKVRLTRSPEAKEEGEQ